MYNVKFNPFLTTNSLWHSNDINKGKNSHISQEEKSKLESGLTNGDEPMDQDLSDVPTKCISTTESIEIK